MFHCYLVSTIIISFVNKALGEINAPGQAPWNRLPPSSEESVFTGRRLWVSSGCDTTFPGFGLDGIGSRRLLRYQEATSQLVIVSCHISVPLKPPQQAQNVYSQRGYTSFVSQVTETVNNNCEFFWEICYWPYFTKGSTKVKEEKYSTKRNSICKEGKQVGRDNFISLEYESCNKVERGNRDCSTFFSSFPSSMPFLSMFCFVKNLGVQFHDFLISLGLNLIINLGDNILKILSWLF